MSERRVPVVTVALSLSTALGMCLAAAFVIGHTPLDTGSSTIGRMAGGLTILAALLLALTALSEPAASTIANPGLAEKALSLQPYSAFAVLALWAIMLRPGDPALTRFDRITVFAALWIAFAVACVFVLNRRDRNDRTVKGHKVISAVPAALCICAVLVVLAVGHSTASLNALIWHALVVFAFTSIVAHGTYWIASSIRDAHTVRRRGELAVRFMRNRPWVIVGCAVAKLIAICVIWLTSAVLDPSAPAMGMTWRAWVIASVVAVLVIVLLAADKRVGLSSIDHDALSRAAGRVAGWLLGALVAIAFAIGAFANVSQQPLAIVGGAAVVAVGAGARWLRRPSARCTAYLLAVLLAAGLAVLLGAKPVVAAAPPATVLTVALTTMAVLAAGLIGGTWMLVRVLRNHQARFPRLKLLLSVMWVVLWIILTTVLQSWLAPTMTPLNVDLALTAALGIAAVLGALGLQREVDGFEIAVTLAVTVLLVDLPALARLLPYPEAVAMAVAVLAVIGPGTAAIWKALSAGTEADARRPATRGLAVASLLYYMLLTLVWLLPQDSVDMVVDAVRGDVLAALAIPLALLLVAGGEWSVKKAQASGEPA